jgi:hypothetical protein
MSRTMLAIAFLVCVSVVVVSISTALVAGRPVAAPLLLDHQTLDFYGGPDDGWRRFELTATIAGERGEGQLRMSVLNPDPAEPREPLTRDLFGDRMGEVKPTATEHKVVLKLIKSEGDLPKVRRALQVVHERKGKNPFADPSPLGDRKIYNVEGPDYGTNRGLILMVSPTGVHRLIYFGRYGGPYAATLEPRYSFDGSVKGDK